MTMLEPGSNGALGSELESGWTLFQSTAMCSTYLNQRLYGVNQVMSSV